MVSTVEIMIKSDQIEVAPVEFWVGDKTLLTRPCAAILNSRQAKYLSANQPWIQNTLHAAAWIAEHEMTLVTGIDLPTWELGLWGTSEVLGYSATLVPVPDWANVDEINRILTEKISDFGLMPQNALMIPFYEKNPRSPKKSWLPRDRWILENVSNLFPVSVRDGGSFADYLTYNTLSSKIHQQFRVSYNPKSEFKPSIPDSFKSLDDLGDWNYLTHWTRSTPRHWPGESSTSFYTDIVNPGSDYPRSAFETLKHILDELQIRASGSKMYQNKKMVALSSAHPADMLNNMVWRRQQVRYSFEPYAIAIKRRPAEALGITKVRYGSSEERKGLTAAERIYFQTDNSDDGVWRKEKEYRFRGDLTLTSLDPSDILVLVPTEAEKEVIRAEYGLPAFALTDR